MSEVLSHIASSFNPYIRTDITIRNPMIKPHVHVGPIKNTCMTWFVFIHLLLLLCEWNQFSSWESPACFLLATHLEGKGIWIVAMINNCQELSTIVNNCWQLSTIVNNYQQLSTIVFPPDRTVGYWDPSLLFPLTTTVALDSLRSQPTNWNQTIRDAI